MQLRNQALLSPFSGQPTYTCTRRGIYVCRQQAEQFVQFWPYLYDIDIAEWNPENWMKTQSSREWPTLSWVAGPSPTPDTDPVAAYSVVGVWPGYLVQLAHTDPQRFCLLYKRSLAMFCCSVMPPVFLNESIVTWDTLIFSPLVALPALAVTVWKPLSLLSS